MAEFSLRLDTSKQPAIPQAVRARVGDAEGCVIAADIVRDGEPYDLTGLDVRFECLLPDGSAVRDSGVSVEGSRVTYSVPIEVVAARGLVKTAYFRVARGTASIDSTESFVIDVKPGVRPCGVGVPDGCVPELDEALAAMRQQAGIAQGVAEDIERAESARSSAEAGRVKAETARASAESSRAAAEKLRASSEVERKSAESKRASEHESLKSASQKATAAAAAAAGRATTAADDALDAAEEARAAAGMVSTDKTIFLAYQTVGDIEYLTLVDESED